ncbi:activator-dependent family glycosyltransferase [Saccharothrix australiensis]|uniref:Glycosyltransferase (Activator-dependent family) n=1 Tax=Saccharothrix australiensis TaxID=2072 RepID=A0A495VZ22_9PSEU|nr:activator-dependent family glycosyltransferase [Saccharothrix australiensis]RKT54691.1 glycosyltransferase (activator-dependent family) [Saccharothrix australiensis]
MRVLLITHPGNTVFYPLVPLAWAFRAAGHEVRVASNPEFADTITLAGLTAVPVGRPGRAAQSAEEPAEGDVDTGLNPPYDAAEDPAKITWEHLRDGYREDVPWWFTAFTAPILADLVAYARWWRPDLVVWEPTSYAGPIVAGACGAAHARALWSLDVFGVTRGHFRRLRDGRPPEDRDDALAESFTRYGRRYGVGFTEDMATGHFTIDLLPPSLALPTDLPRVGVRFVPYGGSASVPRWLWAPPERPRVAITLGSSLLSERPAEYGFDLQDVLDSLADLDVDVVATVADRERALLRRIPPGATIVPYVPLHALAPTCSAIVHHAGIGTLATTSFYGVPQLALPWEFDEPLLARNLAAQGAGLAVDPAGTTAGDIRENLLRILREPSFKHSAERLGEEMRTMPSPLEAVREIERRTAAHRT